MTVDELMREALRLKASDRASMAHKLLSSLESLSEAEVEKLWVEEALRRSAEIDGGLVETIPADQVIAEARARLK
jgi:Putative addiction module component